MTKTYVVYTFRCRVPFKHDYVLNQLHVEPVVLYRVNITFALMLSCRRYMASTASGIAITSLRRCSLAHAVAMRNRLATV